MHVLVKPMGKPVPQPPSRPPMGSKVVKAVQRNLFGTPCDGEIDAIFEEEQKLNLDYVLRRYNFDIKELEKAERTEKCSANNSSSSSSNDSAYKKPQRRVTALSPYLRLPSVKESFRVCKHMNGSSNVPKRKDNLKLIKHNNNNNNNNNININNKTQVISHNSGMGASNGLEKKKDVEQQQQQQ